MNTAVSVPRILPSPLLVGGASVAPGTKAVLDVPLTELSDGTIIPLPVVVINGARPGPRLYVGAAIHGDEVAGVSIIAGVLKDMDPRALSGSIIAVPVQHPLAFHADHRIPVSQFIKSPLDQAPIDAWTCFPGDAEGNLSQQLAAKLFELIKMCSFAFDIHTPTRGGRYVPISILPGPRLAITASKHFGSPSNVTQDSSYWVRGACTSIAASSVSKQLRPACLHLRLKSAKGVALSPR